MMEGYDNLENDAFDAYNDATAELRQDKNKSHATTCRWCAMWRKRKKQIEASG